MIPGAWAGVILALGAFRLTRLIGWDDFPPILRLRRWATGEFIVNHGSSNTRMGLTNEEVEEEIRHRWPTLSKFLWCPWCLGAWVSLGVYVAWRLEASWTLAACFVLALSAFVGLVAKNLDP